MVAKSSPLEKTSPFQNGQMGFFFQYVRWSHFAGWARNHACRTGTFESSVPMKLLDLPRFTLFCSRLAVPLMMFSKSMNFQIEELITNYLEWQVANHGKGASVLAAWKEVFVPKSRNTGSSTSKCVTVRKGAQMKSLALFFDKGDASTSVPTIGDSHGDKNFVTKDFSSVFDALMYVAACEEKLKGTDDNIPSGDTKKISNPSIMKKPALNVEAREDIKNNGRHISTDASDVARDALQPSSKRLKLESDAAETGIPETLEDFPEPDDDGSKQCMHPNYRLKAALWDQRFQELEALWDGDTTVYQNHISANRSLTNWVKHQRKCFKRGLVSEERMNKLQSIGFKWVGRNSVVLSKQPQDEYEVAAAKQAFSVNAARQKQLLDDRNDAWSALWDTRFKELVEYKQRFGDTKVPKEWAENRKLAGWVRKQREQYRKQAFGETTALTDSRKRKLMDVGFIWSLRPGRLKHPLPPLPEPTGQTCIMGKEGESRDVEAYSVDKNGYLII